MTETVAYVRVSTEDQVEFSPDAQAKRCRDFARLRDLGPVRVLADEGWSGKNLDRPHMRELLDLVAAGGVAHLVIWRWDRLSRDQGDFSTLVGLFERHGVQVHSVNEGDLDLSSASGKMQIGVHGVFAQYYRDSLVENVKMGNRQAIEQKGRWLNRAPTGYSMVDGYLEPNEMAPLVQRIFALRAAGSSYPAIEAEVGIGYSTVRHICENRAYLGQTQIKGEWFPAIHEPLVTLAEFDAAGRAHTPGKRRSKDLLTGFVRCGLCGRIAGVEYNERNQALYRCKHRGEGCKQPARSANGLQRAAVLGLRTLAEDKDLQAAIRHELTAHHRAEPPSGPSAASTIAALGTKRRKLLDLYYADKISPDAFADEEQRLTAQIDSLRSEAADLDAEHQRRDDLAERFDQVAELLASLDLDAIWDEATTAERRTLVEDLVDAVCIYPDQITVQVAGAPPILVTLAEVGLRAGTKTVVSEGRPHRSLRATGADRGKPRCSGGYRVVDEVRTQLGNGGAGQTREPVAGRPVMGVRSGPAPQLGAGLEGGDQVSVIPMTLDSMIQWLTAYRGVQNPSGSSVANLVVCGDSITEGWYTTGSLRRWIDVMQNKFEVACNNQSIADAYLPCATQGGYGYQPKQWTAANATLRTDLGLGYQAAQLAHGTGSLDYTTIHHCTEFWVFYPTFASGYGTFDVIVNGTTTVATLNNVAGSPRGSNVYKHLVGGASTIELTLKSTTGATNDAVVEGVYFFNGNETQGVRIWNGGHFGYNSGEFSAIGASYWWTAGFDTILPDAVMVALQTDDQTAGINPGTYQSNMVAIASQIYAAMPSPLPTIVFVAPMGIDNVSGAHSMYSSDIYRQAMYWAARDSSLTPPAAVLDFEAVAGYMGQAAGGNPFNVGYTLTGSAPFKHPNDMGHLLLGTAAFNFMSASAAVPSVSAYGQSADPLGWAFPYTALGSDQTGFMSLPSANSAMFMRSLGGGLINHVILEVSGTPAGTISLAALDGPSGPNPPATVLATTNSITCPPTGVVDQTLATFAPPPAYVSPTTGWLGISASSTSPTFAVAGGSGSAGSNIWGNGNLYVQPAGSGTPHPIEAGSLTGLLPCTYGRFVLQGSPS